MVDILGDSDHDVLRLTPAPVEVETKSGKAVRYYHSCYFDQWDTASCLMAGTPWSMCFSFCHWKYECSATT